MSLKYEPSSEPLHISVGFVTLNLEWCDKIKLSNLLLPRNSGTIKSLQLIESSRRHYAARGPVLSDPGDARLPPRPRGPARRPLLRPECVQPYPLHAATRGCVSERQTDRQTDRQTGREGERGREGGRGRERQRDVLSFVQNVRNPGRDHFMVLILQLTCKFGRETPLLSVNMSTFEVNMSTFNSLYDRLSPRPGGPARRPLLRPECVYPYQ